mmetsp:Transcript_55309/g.108229  ORF Transcript_55309/g.108229 Transcript_55309/m.108229 type:complete len:252 (+) Transcript_55309:1218-1973(+)
MQTQTPTTHPFTKLTKERNKGRLAFTPQREEQVNQTSSKKIDKTQTHHDTAMQSKETSVTSQHAQMKQQKTNRKKDYFTKDRGAVESSDRLMPSLPLHQFCHHPLSLCFSLALSSVEFHIFSLWPKMTKSLPPCPTHRRTDKTRIQIYHQKAAPLEDGLLNSSTSERTSLPRCPSHLPSSRVQREPHSTRVCLMRAACFVERRRCPCCCHGNVHGGGGAGSPVTGRGRPVSRGLSLLRNAKSDCLHLPTAM